MTGYFHEKAASCQVHVLVVRHDGFPPTSGRRTVLAFPPTSSIADSPYFHPHSFVEFSLPCQLGVLNLERVLPSRSRTGCRCFQRPRS